MKNRIDVQLDELMPIIKEKLEIGADITLIASGNSMYPLFRHQRDTYNLVKLNGQPHKYDMILYQRDNGKYVLHRIVGLNSNGYILRGDNQFINEYGIKDEHIIAKVDSFCRNGKDMNCRQISYRIYVLLWVHSVYIRRIYRAIQRRIFK